ncbi:cation diffusion facilitator family transporter [Oribacterium sp. WCC10]|uniref:cation diffusion facilitator family transporter n=1 Tax=Oribacterium sp. WCC10 TaxID=1855343 RepID=UPI0008E34B39|nr:cation diffusion facilitator family transporter [Oribacterium sp. WCC10]SFG14685.1 cation diffusion facilitator family transporter [Oribacterium sp. WCC10]
MAQLNKDYNRDAVIIRTSIIGIFANIFLAAFKAMVGIMSNSIAIVLDAVNNLSDAMSSVITIVGTKLAGKQPDKKHPMGYGRVEYISATIIAVIVLYAGVTSFTESMKKIIHPEAADYSTTALIIVAAGVVVKIILGRYVKSIGEKVKSDSLIASGSDATMDSIISASTLVAAVIYMFTGLSLEAWLGAVISVIIIKAGFDILKDTISQILGERVEASFSKAIKMTVASFPEIQGAYDLILHAYGPDTYMGSVHIEVPDTMNAVEIDRLMRDIQHKVYNEHKVILEGISIYSTNTKDDKTQAMLHKTREIVMSRDHVLQMHGFYVDEARKNINFDVIIDFAIKNREKIFEEIENEVHKAFPEYTLEITMDSDISD